MASLAQIPARLRLRAFGATQPAARLIVLRHKLQRERPFNLRRERCFDFAPQHGQRDKMAASLTIRRRRMVAIEFGT